MYKNSTKKELHDSLKLCDEQIKQLSFDILELKNKIVFIEKLKVTIEKELHSRQQKLF